MFIYYDEGIWMKIVQHDGKLRCEAVAQCWCGSRSCKVNYQGTWLNTHESIVGKNMNVQMYWNWANVIIKRTVFFNTRIMGCRKYWYWYVADLWFCVNVMQCFINVPLKSLCFIYVSYWAVILLTFSLSVLGVKNFQSKLLTNILKGEMCDIKEDLLRNGTKYT